MSFRKAARVARTECRWRPRPPVGIPGWTSRQRIEHATLDIPNQIRVYHEFEDEGGRNEDDSDNRHGEQYLYERKRDGEDDHDEQHDGEVSEAERGVDDAPNAKCAMTDCFRQKWYRTDVPM